MTDWQTLTTRHARRLVDKFGRDFTWTPDGGSPVTVRGILDHNYMDATGGVGIQTAHASVMVVADDVSGIDTGDAWADGGTNYLISGLEPDGEGVIDIILMRV